MKKIAILLEIKTDVKLFQEREVISQYIVDNDDQGGFWTGGKDQNGDNQLTWIGGIPFLFNLSFLYSK